MTTSRGVRWLQRRTNIADLLDDGVENYSDLRNAAASAREASEPESPPAPPRQPDAERIPVRLAPVRASRLGVLIGAGMAISCALLYLHPADFIAFHPGTRTTRLRLEHVTPERCRAYGAIGVVVGVGLLAFSLYRPRNHA